MAHVELIRLLLYFRCSRTYSYITCECVFRSMHATLNYYDSRLIATCFQYGVFTFPNSSYIVTLALPIIVSFKLFITQRLPALNPYRGKTY